MEGSGFTGSSTAEEVTKGVDASGLTAIVTGATAGIGTETARVLALRGAHVYLTGRSVKSAKETNEAILKDLPDAKLDILAPLDLCSQASVRKCAESVMMIPHGLTVDGIEIHFGTNHIGHFLLTNLLLDKLKESANKTGIESRIVILSSKLLPKESIAWDKINEDKGRYGLTAYGISKMANIYHAQELTKRLQGAATTVYVALHPSVKGVSGKFFVDSNEFDPKVYHPLAEDEQESKKCWDLGVQLTST